MPARVLVTDPLAEEGLALLQEHLAVDARTDLDAAGLLAAIPAYDALLVRSRTQVTAEVVAAARRLRVIGRAGTGVDNIDLTAATRQGILVVNAPAGNTVAVAEHTVGLMLSLARHIPHADATMRSGQWAKKELQGIELRGKTLGLVGFGRIGSAVARRARAMEMTVLAYDPFVAQERAASLGVQLVPLGTLLARADFVSLHVPLTSQTQNMIGQQELAQIKSSARLINTARGGLVDEGALLEALNAGRLAGAAIDVFEQEPPEDNPLLTHPRVVITPHIAASTAEAQQGAALEVARQVVDVLAGRAPRYPVNAPALSPEELAEIEPYRDLALRLGRFYAQVMGNRLQGITLDYAGQADKHNTDLLTAAAIQGLLDAVSDEPVNWINARAVAQERGLTVAERRGGNAAPFTGLVTLCAETASGQRSVAGTVMRGEPHVVAINGYWLDFLAEGFLLVSEHTEGPGILGRVGTLLGQAGINISFVQLGRRGRGRRGVMVLGLDDSADADVLASLMTLPSIHSARLVHL
jgi:D-3-phosphoglycerate dehydrogenase